MGRNYETHKKWLHTPIGRASTLLNSYNHKDEKQNRGKGNLTSKWIVEHIFSQPCAHCGKIGWDVIGCNRLNNDLPHTKDNVEPCCKECNDRLHNIERSKKVYQYTLDGKFVAIYSSTKEAAKINNYSQGNIYLCCIGKRKSHNGYKWSFEPL